MPRVLPLRRIDLPNHAFGDVRFIWKNGAMVPFEQATVHVLSHVMHYGSGWFEGIRCYKTPSGPAVFRLHDHMERLAISCKIFRVELPYSVDVLEQASREVILANGFEACYLRPLIFRGLGALGVNPLSCPVETVIAAWPWGAYLGSDALERGVDVCVSSWRRYEGSTFPANCKATGAYLNAQLIKMEAVLAGFEEGIALDPNGYLSEGSAENLFAVHKGELWTPPLAASILEGITRATVVTLAGELGLRVREEAIPRGFLYACEEIFLTGTAVEITPVRSIDRIPVGDGKPGPITRRLQERFIQSVTGQIEDRHGWLTPVSEVAALAV